MQLTIPSSTLGKPNVRASKPSLSLVAIHDGLSAGIRAKEALVWVNHALRADLQVHSVCWSFEQLERLDLRATSIRAAAAADMLIVSASDEIPLPDHIKKWLVSSLAEQWRTHPILIALQDETLEINCTQRRFCMYLKQVADSLQTKFMCNEDFDKILDREFASQLIHEKSQGSNHRTKPFGEEFYSTPRRWGING